MEKRNLFVSGKAVVAAVCGAFTAAFRLAGLACCGVGRLHGAGLGQRQRRRPAGGAWSSAAARAGIWHKAGMVVVVLVCA